MAQTAAQSAEWMLTEYVSVYKPRKCWNLVFDQILHPVKFLFSCCDKTVVEVRLGSRLKNKQLLKVGKRSCFDLMHPWFFTNARCQPLFLATWLQILVILSWQERTRLLFCFCGGSHQEPCMTYLGSQLIVFLQAVQWSRARQADRWWAAKEG